MMHKRSASILSKYMNFLQFHCFLVLWDDSVTTIGISITTLSLGCKLFYTQKDNSFTVFFEEIYWCFNYAFILSYKKAASFFNNLLSLTIYLRQTLVFLRNRALREKFNVCFSEFFWQYWQNFYFGKKTWH